MEREIRGPGGYLKGGGGVRVGRGGGGGGEGVVSLCPLMPLRKCGRRDGGEKKQRGEDIQRTGYKTGERKGGGNTGNGR